MSEQFWMPYPEFLALVHPEEAVRRARRQHPLPEFRGPRWHETAKRGSAYLVKVRLEGRATEKVWAELLGPAMAPGTYWVRMDSDTQVYPELRVGNEFVVVPDDLGFMHWDVRRPGPVKKGR